MSMLKRQRELKKSEKAAKKRARRHGVREDGIAPEPRPTVELADLLGASRPDEEQDSAAESENEAAAPETEH